MRLVDAGSEDNAGRAGGQDRATEIDRTASVSDPQGLPIISRDRSFNEYFLLRTAF